jgi:hypothetical protein
MANLSDIITPTNVVAVAPGANGNVLQSNGTAWTSAALSVGISNIVTATGNTTLTSTPTLLRITPTNYGTTVTLPNATTMTVGTGKFTIQNLSEYHVRIVNASNTLLGFVYSFGTVNIDLASAATSAGTWVLNNATRLGISAYYADSAGLITSLGGNDVRVLELDSDRQFYLFASSTNLLYGQVYNQTTNTFGSPTLIRNTANVSGNAGIALINANAILVVSIPGSGTAGQAVVLSISGTTITVNTATSFTSADSLASSGMQFFRAIPSGGFIYGYAGSGSSNIQLVPISVSGTTPSVGTEVTAFTSVTPVTTTFAHTATDKLILFAGGDGGNQGGFRAFSLSGNTITSGSLVNTSISATNATRFVKLTDTTYFFGCNTASAAYVGVISLSGLTITRYISSALGTTNATVFDSISVSSTKVFFTLSTSIYYNILTFTGSSVTLGTAITAAPALTSSACYALKGNDVAAGNSSTLVIVDCSGASPSIRSSTAVGTVLGGSATVHDGAPVSLQTSDIEVLACSSQPTVQTALAFNSVFSMPNIGTPNIASFSWYSGNNRTPRDNFKMAFSMALVSGSWAVLRKIELA